jgi:hypothetical protein
LTSQDLSITERAINRRTSDDESALSAAEAESLEKKIDVSYGKWIEVEYDGMRDVIRKYSDDDFDNPFSTIIKGGALSYTNTANSLKLDDIDTYGRGDSGYLKLVLKEGWMVELDVLTEDFNYFNHNIDDTVQDRFAHTGTGDSFTPVGELVSRIDFWLIAGGDQLSIDIDNDSTKVAQFYLKIDGAVYSISNPDNFDDEVKVWLKQAWYWNADYGTITFVGEDLTNPDLISSDDLILTGTTGTTGSGLGPGGDGGETIYPEASILGVLLLVGGILWLSLRGGKI